MSVTAITWHEDATCASPGAIYGAALVREGADRFPAIAMSEGGYEQLTDPTFARRFHANGGRRVLLGCDERGAARFGEGGGRPHRGAGRGGPGRLAGVLSARKKRDEHEDGLSDRGVHAPPRL